MLVRETEKKQRKLEKVERDQILLEGGNPDEVFLKRQRIEMFKKTKAAFTKKQRDRQLQIVSQLLKESRMQKRLETKFSKSHWHNREQAPHPSKRNLHLQKKRKVTMLHAGSGAVDVEGGCIPNCFMLSSLPCFHAFCWSAIPTSCYVFNVVCSCSCHFFLAADACFNWGLPFNIYRAASLPSQASSDDGTCSAVNMMRHCTHQCNK